MKQLVLVAVTILMSSPAMGDWAIKGEGNFSCPDYVSAKRSNSAKLYSSVSWVQGFITGVNYQSALPVDSHSFIAQDFPATSIVAWLDNYCRDNPQDYLADAAEALVTELKLK